MKYLITGFGPFADHKINPSGEFIKSFDFPGCDKFLLPVDYQKSLEFIRDKELRHYDFIFLFGLAAERNEICLERVALNWIESSLPDNNGQAPTPQKINPELQEAWINPWPLEVWARHLVEKHMPVKISHSAGAYLCNFLYFHIIQKNPKALFIHIPKDVDLKQLGAITKELISLVESESESFRRFQT